MATDLFYTELETTIGFFMQARDEQRAADAMVAASDIDASAQADIEARTDRILNVAKTKAATIDRDMI